MKCYSNLPTAEVRCHSGLFVEQILGNTNDKNLGQCLKRIFDRNIARASLRVNVSEIDTNFVATVAPSFLSYSYVSSSLFYWNCSITKTKTFEGHRTIFCKCPGCSYGLTEILSLVLRSNPWPEFWIYFWNTVSSPAFGGLSPLLPLEKWTGQRVTQSISSQLPLRLLHGKWLRRWWLHIRSACLIPIYSQAQRFHLRRTEGFKVTGKNN